jgi:hypothetical protein
MKELKLNSWSLITEVDIKFWRRKLSAGVNVGSNLGWNSPYSERDRYWLETGLL